MTKTPITVHIHGAIAVTPLPGITATRRFLESQVPRRVSDLLPLNRLLSRSSTRLIGTSRSISRILSRPLPAGAIIHLRPLLPTAWCDLPGDSGEQPSSASADACTRPFDLAPGGVYRAIPVTWDAGGLLHRRFTLTSVSMRWRAPHRSSEAVCFLWHCPAGYPGWVLPTTLLCGVRTFLGDVCTSPRSPNRLVHPSA
jgi:hypothetical protein